MRAIPSKIAVVALAACTLLSACGGGDDNGNGAGTAPAQGETPSPAPSPSPTPTPSPAPKPAPTGEPLPSLTSPQPGSTAEVGNGSEGIWSEAMGATFIDSAGRFIRAELVGMVNGGFQFTGATWNFTPDTISEFMFVKSVTGSGTIAQNSKLDGSYQVPGQETPKTISATYDPANALAVDQASIQGKWKQGGLELSVDDQGNLSGTYTSGSKICALAGSAVLAEPGSAKNLYRVTLAASLRPSRQAPAAICPLASRIRATLPFASFLPMAASLLPPVRCTAARSPWR